ncbi:hypothetical protein ACQKIY_25295 [Bacillus mycoides]|uniref:hypothetical protein n=1 Tax=Bacillus mycoides TaxID=1405 RepID=UPI003CFF16F7
MLVPEILDEQELIIEWVRKWKKRHFSMSTIIESLVSDKPWKEQRSDDDYMKARDIYNQYNNYYRSNVLKAIMMDCYRKEHDIKEGQIVTNGLVVGFADNFDLSKRIFFLYSSKDQRFTLGKFKIDDFAKVEK